MFHLRNFVYCHTITELSHLSLRRLFRQRLLDNRICVGVDKVEHLVVEVSLNYILLQRLLGAYSLRYIVNRSRRIRVVVNDELVSLVSVLDIRSGGIVCLPVLIPNLDNEVKGVNRVAVVIVRCISVALRSGAIY